MKNYSIFKPKPLKFYYPKYITLYIGLFLMPMVILSGCKKENLQSTSLTQESRLDALSLLADLNNSENSQINQILFVFTEAIKEASLNPNLLVYMKQNLETDTKSFGVSITELAKQNSVFEEKIAISLRNSIRKNNLNFLSKKELEIGDRELLRMLSSKMICRNESYEPVIYHLAKSEVTFRDQRTIIAIAEEVTEEDEVLAYYNDDSIPFLLSEEMARVSTDEIIFV